MALNPTTTELLTTEASQYLGQQLATSLGTAHRHTVRELFSDGEHYYRIDVATRTELRGKDVIMVGSTHTDNDLLELYRIGCALAEAGTRQRLFVIPFFGYSTMERAVHPGEVVTAKANARLLSTIPQSGWGNQFIFLDLHAPGLLHYFEGDSVCLELSAEAILVAALKKLRLKDFVMASADLGMPLAVQRLAQYFKTSIALISKTRSFEHTKVLAAIGDVKNKDVVIYDDMTRSGSSLIQAAAAYRKQGAREVYALISHFALNSSQVVKDLEKSALKKIITTNSHPLSQDPAVKESKKITVCDITPVLTQTLQQ